VNLSFTVVIDAEEPLQALVTGLVVVPMLDSSRNRGKAVARRQSEARNVAARPLTEVDSSEFASGRAGQAPADFRLRLCGRNFKNPRSPGTGLPIPAEEAPYWAEAASEGTEEESQKRAGDLRDTQSAEKFYELAVVRNTVAPHGNECGSFTRVNGSLPFLRIRARCTWSALSSPLSLSLSL